MRAFIIFAFLFVTSLAQATMMNINYENQKGSLGINVKITDVYFHDGYLNVRALDGDHRVACRIPKEVLAAHGFELIGFMKHALDHSANSTFVCRGKFDANAKNSLTVEAQVLELLIIGKD